MNQLISNFTPSALSNFFKTQISSFVPQSEEIDNSIKGNDTKSFSSLTKHGETILKDKNELLVFSCKHNGALSERSSRRKQFEIAKKVLKDDFKDGAIFVFYDDKGKFRFSFIRKNWGEKGDKRYSTWNRFTYFVDPKETNKTFKDRVGNCKFTGLDEIQDAFSVEKLTKEFYNDLFKWYQWALSEEIGITFPNNTSIIEDDRAKLEEQIIRLITRQLFVWFIKQKHLVPDLFFDKGTISTILKNFDPTSRSEGNYYNAILQNLFFATLNKSVKERDFAKLQNSRDIKTLYRYEEMFSITKEEVLQLFSPIPFLNGGLFECLDKEDIDGNKYYLDGFSRNDKKLGEHFKHRAFIPNCLFFDKEKGLIPLLERYNFTVEENVPNEVQVALDPELLGNVFENLLGAFNTETKENARKQSGSFYTPREIVSYMIDESLIAYLLNKFPALREETIQQLFETESLPSILKEDHSLCEQISEALRKIKILDPACGSGAFPMGILNKMVEILQKLDCNDKQSIYDQKLHLIEQCIYGVDIQTIAAQISKLRFFISLICEQGPMDFEKENYGVITLPNLETKFVAANTLIAIKRKPAQQNLFENPEIEKTKRELLAIRKEHFYAKTASSKKGLREQDAELREKLFKLLQTNGDFAPEDAVQFSKWNPYDQNSSSPFFDPEWMFGLIDGFDLVIGNPPYIQLQDAGGRLAKIFEDCNYKTFARKGDIYSLFYERGWQLLMPNGALCFITSNKWMRAEYGERTRSFLSENTNPLLLVDFAGQKIFNSATVDTNILLFSKAKNEKKTRSCIVKEKVLNKMSDYLRQSTQISQFASAESWVVLTPLEKRIKDKIEAIGTPLKNWDININYGIKTGLNDAFIIDEAKRIELIEEDPKSAEIIRPILRGRDIKKYGFDFHNLWLINTHNGIKEKGIKPIEINDFPAIKKHLDQFYPELEKRLDKGITPYNLRNCAYMDDFNRQKIVWGEISDKTKFSIDLEGSFVAEATTFIMTGDSIIYLLGFLNSKLSQYLFSKIGTTTGVGTVRWKKFTIEKLFVPQQLKSSLKDYETIVLEIIDCMKSNKQYFGLLQKIDKMIYDEFDLDADEREFIDSQ